MLPCEARKAIQVVKLTLKLKVETSCCLQRAQSVKGITSWCADRSPGNMRRRKGGEGNENNCCSGQSCFTGLHEWHLLAQGCPWGHKRDVAGGGHAAVGWWQHHLSDASQGERVHVSKWLARCLTAMWCTSADSPSRAHLVTAERERSRAASVLDCLACLSSSWEPRMNPPAHNPDGNGSEEGTGPRMSWDDSGCFFPPITF